MFLKAHASGCTLELEKIDRRRPARLRLSAGHGDRFFLAGGFIKITGCRFKLYLEG